MTATTTGSRFGAATPGSVPAVGVPPPPPAGEVPAGRAGRRRMLLLSAAAVVVLAGGFLVGRLTAGDGTSAWQATRLVPAGSRVTEADVRRVRVNRSALAGLRPITGSPVGAQARVHLLAGTLVGQEHLGEGGPLATGEVLVDLTLPANRLPAGPLRDGTKVWVVYVPSVDAPKQPLSMVATDIPVWSVQPGPGSAVVTLRVPAAVGAHLRLLAERGRLALVGAS